MATRLAPRRRISFEAHLTAAMNAPLVLLTTRALERSLEEPDNRDFRRIQ